MTPMHALLVITVAAAALTGTRVYLIKRAAREQAYRRWVRRVRAALFAKRATPHDQNPPMVLVEPEHFEFAVEAVSERELDWADEPVSVTLPNRDLDDEPTVALGTMRATT